MNRKNNIFQTLKLVLRKIDLDVFYCILDHIVAFVAMIVLNILHCCVHVYLMLYALWFLMRPSTIFQLFRGRQFYWWRKLEYPKKTTDKEPSHRLGFSLFAIECRMDYMGTSVLMTRLSKLDIELKDERHVETI
jgi:hypothetical protein